MKTATFWQLIAGIAIGLGAVATAISILDKSNKPAIGKIEVSADNSGEMAEKCFSAAQQMIQTERMELSTRRSLESQTTAGKAQSAAIDYKRWTDKASAARDVFRESLKELKAVDKAGKYSAPIENFARVGRWLDTEIAQLNNTGDNLARFSKLAIHWTLKDLMSNSNEIAQESDRIQAERGY